MEIRCNYCGTIHNVSKLKLHFYSLLGRPYFWYCKNCLLCNCTITKLRTYHDSTNKKEKSINKNILERKL